MERLDFTKIAIAGALLLFLAFAIWQIIVFRGRYADAEARYEQAAKALEEARTDNARFKAEIDYYQIPENLEKELRARFNYRYPDEKTLIFVPAATSTPPR